jgi:hypothetical protein
VVSTFQTERHKPIPVQDTLVLPLRAAVILAAMPMGREFRNVLSIILKEVLPAAEASTAKKLRKRNR